MKVDTSRLKKGTSEVPPECQQLIDRLRQCSHEELFTELSKIETWTFGKCELYHWIDILDIFDSILEQATEIKDSNEWCLACDISFDEKGIKLLLLVLNFTTLLIEHSFSRHLYNSVEHLTRLLSSSNMEIVLGVLNLLYMFSKRSNFISRLNSLKKNSLLTRLNHIAESWGGKEYGFGLANCCREETTLPAFASTFFYEYYNQEGTLDSIEIPDLDKCSKHPAQIAQSICEKIEDLDDDQKMHIFTRIRLSVSFHKYPARLQFVQARLQALSVLVYSNSLQENIHALLYPGFLEELVELLEMKEPHLVEIRAAALRTLTSIIHLDRNPHFPKKPGSRLAMIIDVTGASSYHGFLPTLVRTCIQNLTASTIPLNMNEDAQRQQQSLEQVQFHDKTMHKIQTLQLQQNLFPLPLATALFSFLYHLASYELGGDALVACGMMESLLKVINWPGYELEHITFVTRAVRVIDLITNIEMQSFQNHGGLNSFIGRLDMEVNICRREQPFEIEPQHDQQTSANNINIRDVRDDSFLVSDDTNMSTDDVHPSTSSQSSSSYSSTAVKVSTPNLSNSLSFEQNSCNSSSSKASKNAKTCLPQRAALLKSMLNFLKKAIQDPSFSESIRHVMEGTLPSSLRHIISNAEYYGPSLFLLATDVVTVYVFQEPSLLSSLQDNGLTDVVLQALLKKDVPATREVLGSLPNVFSALCLNARGLAAFVKYNPFDRLFKVLLSPVYLLAMRRRRSSDPMGDTASNLGNAMDELMRHQPSLKSEATKAIIKLLEELVTLGTDPKYICWRATTKNETSPTPQNRQTNGNTGGDAGSSDEEDDDEEEASTSSHHNQREDNSNEATTNNSQHEMYERTPIPLIDYILNVMKFVDAILSNNSTDDHCREFVLQGGLKPLLSILALPNLPVDSPITASAQAVAAVCKSILNLAHEPQVLQVGLEQLAVVVDQLKPLQTHNATSVSSVLLHELATCPNIHAAFSNASYTPLLHAMSAVHGYIVMLVHVCRTGQTDIRTLLLTKWAQNTPYGKKLLKNLVDLYTSLVWESTLLLALCTDDIFPAGCDFGKEDIEKLPSECPEETMSNSDANILSCVKVIKSGSQASSNGMDLDSSSDKTSSRDDDQKTAGKKIMATPGQLRYIKALLGASSRLGRALAELFGNLVKLCVGSPIRRRGQNFPPTPVFTSTESRDIARVLSYVLVDGFSHEKLLPSPVLKLKFTFFICSVGFTGPMLFDEKRYAFHLILHKFVEEGGLEAFFDMFRWVITAGEPISIKTAISNQNFADGTGEFLDAWLMLLEKMVNTKAILESPHIISTRAVRSKSEFDATLYLITIHRMAFNTVTQLWGMKPLPTYGVRMTESIMSILKHILKSDILLKEKYKKRMANVSEPPTTNINSDQNLLVNQEHLRQLMDMGFSREHVTNALIRTFSMEQATDYLLNQCSPPPLPAEVISQQSPQQQQASSANRPDRSSTPLMFQMDLDGEEDHTNRTSVVNMGQSSKYRRKYILPTEPLSDKVLNRFSKTALEKCLYLMDQLPETVSKGVELMAILYERNSASWKFDFLNELADQLSCCMKVVNEGFKNPSKHEDIFFGEWSNKFYVRLLVCCLFCDEMYTDIRIEMAHRLKGRDCEFDMIHLIPEFLSCIKKYPPPSNNNGERTPRWLAQIVTLLDLLEKVSVYTQRKYDMHKVTTRVWKWYDVASGKWNAYSVSNNRIINEAYWSGEPSVRVSCGRQRYAINFNCMSQVNEETGNHRPVILALKATENKPETQSEETLPMSLITSDESEGETEEKTKENREHKLYENEYDVSFRLQGLDIYPTREIVANLVQLMSSEISVSRDALHAIMKFLVRLTKTYENAKIFAQEGGVRLLLNMKQSCGYIGFPTLSILLIRHVLEEPKTLELAMERVISNRTIQSIPPGYRDLVFLLRQMSSAISRDPDTFEKVAKAVLRVDISVLKRNPVNEDNRLLLKSIPSTKRTDVMEEPVSIEVVHDLLNALVIPCPHSSSSEQPLPQPSPDVPHNKASNHPASSDSATPSSSMAVSIASPAREAVHSEIIDSNASSHDARNPFQHISDGNSAVNANIALPSSSHQNRRSRLGNYTSSDSHRSNDKEDDCCGWHIPCQTREHDKPLLPKGTILKFLADAVRSYQTLAPLITGHVYRAGITPLITENTSALSFILDKLLTSNDASVNREVSSMCRVLIAALASCSEQTSVQYNVVSEVKAAINRALTLAESADKHSQLQILVGLIPTMIENCPSENSKNNLQPKRNDIFYIMVRKGLITDLAKLTQYLDLSSPHTIATINAVLKPLETLLRMTNQPGPVPLTSKNKKTQATGSTPATAASSSAVDGVSTPRRSSNGDEPHGVRNSDIANAQDEQIIDDQDQSEADMSGVDNMGLNNDTIQDNIDDIMEELLERAVNIENDRTGSRIGTSTDESRGDNLGNFHVADIALETSSESGDSDSNASDNDEREIDEDDENEEEAEDRSEIDIDEGTRQYIEIYDHVYGRHLSPSVGNNDQADQEASGGSSGTNPILVHVNFPNIFESVTSHNLSQNSGSNATSGNSLLNSRYSTASAAEGSVNNDAAPTSSGSTMNRISSISNIDNGNASTQVGSSNVNSSQNPSGNAGATSQSQSSSSHRLLSVPRAMRTQSGNSSSENTNIRQRRYQLLNWNSRNTPVILQRLLGPGSSNSNGNANNGAQTQGENQGSNSGSNAGHANVFRDAARVILMDNIFGGSTDEGSIDLVDQSGYLFGRSLAATLSSTPTALHWWLEEAKALGLESQSDICLTVANSLIPELENYKEAELARVRSKRKKKPTEDESRAKGDIASATRAPEEKENNLLTPRTDQQNESRDSNIEQGSGDNARNFVIGMDTADANVTSVQPAPSSQEQRTQTGGSEILTDSEELEQSSTSHNPTTHNTTNEGDENEVNDDDDEDEDDEEDDDDEEDEDDVANNSSEQESSEIGDEPVIFNRSNRDCLCVDQQDEEQQQNSPSNLHSNNDDSSNAAGDTIGDNESEEIDVEGLPYSIVMGSTSISLLPPPPPTHQAITDDEMAAAVLIPLPIDDDEEDFNDILQILDRTANITNSPRRSTGMSETSASGQVTVGPTSGNGMTESVASTQNRSNETQEEEGAVGGAPQRSRNTDDVLVFPPPRPDEACNDIPPLDPSEEIVEDSQDPPNVSSAAAERQINHNEHNQQVEAEADHVRNVLGDLEVPEGVDPSFLAALPHDMREEVIAEHLRLQRIRQRAQQNAVQFEHASVAEVNPEFLAALPPSIQEEVLTQQRIEQQRQAAATANPNDPVDAAAFFQNLQPSLRQAILTDMEDSQISVLPPELAAEAQNLRRDWENRNRQLMQERLFHQIGSTANFSSVLRYRRGGFRFPGANMIRPRWTRLSTGGTSGEGSSPSLMTLMERQGRPILDHEALTSLLILLFIDEPKFNTLRLHRVIRNLCCHVPTREWIIKSLLSIIERSNLNSTVASNTSPLTISTRPQWLNIRLDAALGSRANVFVIKKAIAVQGIADKVAENYIVSIHPQASQTVCKHTIDLLITLAKTFPKNFLPCKKQDTSSGINLDKHKSTSRSTAEKPGPSTGHNSANKNCTDFWDIIVKLDCSAPQRKARGPGTQSASSTSQGRSSSSASQQEVVLGNKENVTFDESPFGQLISMLSYDIVKKSCQLTDKLLRLLSFISVGLPDEMVSMNKVPTNETNVAGTSTSRAVEGKRTGPEGSTSVPNVQINESLLPNSEDQLLLAIEVLTSKSCSEEGLEDATSLLLNMSQCSNQTRTVILNLLIRGAKDLARMVKRQITDLMLELKEINCKHKSNFPTPTSTDTSPEEQTGSIHIQQATNMPSTSLGVQLPCSTKTKGILQDRFTKETVIITAPTKVKQTCELQLTSMIPLISKTSSQAFFLRILKVIIQIREAVREAINKDENKSRIVLGPTELTPLSETLGLDDLWDTLSDCLLELEETADNHAVLVLQPAVEAFFLVHASQQNKSNRSNQRQRDEQQNSQRQNQANDTNSSAAPVANAQASQSRPNAPATTASRSNSSVVDPLSPITITFSHEYEAEEYDDSDAASTVTAPDAGTTTQEEDDNTANKQQPEEKQLSSTSREALNADQKKFLQFAEKHRTVLNQILRQTTTHLSDGPFAVLVDHTRILDFDVKRRYFRTELDRLDEGIRREELAIHVHRVTVFEDSFRELYRRNPEEWKNRFYIVFEDEEGQDAGGLLREWYVIISREIFNPMYALFTVSPGDRVTYMINPSSHANPNHLCYYKFVGRVIAKAIYDNKLLECYFTRSFYKHILGTQVKYTDMESEDYGFYKGLVFLLENHISALGYELTFSLEVQEFGVTEVRDLIPNGRNIPVTEENKLEYIHLVCQLKMSGSIRQQLNAFLDGFYDIIPKRLISIFNEQELELLISGLPIVDIEDLKANTEYHKYQANSIQIQWFWRALRSFDQADRAKFLQFVTGTSKVPLQGFGALEGMNGIQKFQIHRDDRSTDRLPSAHTCFNQLDLPVYKTYDKLRSSLLKAIHECSEGFGFA